jgi:hypothetical protein
LRKDENGKEKKRFCIYTSPWRLALGFGCRGPLVNNELAGGLAADLAVQKRDDE